MGGIRGLSSLSRYQISTGATRTVTTRADVSVTLWVEHGAVALVTSCDPEASAVAAFEGGGAVPLAPGEVHLRNTGDVPALVFVAMTELESAPSADTPDLFTLRRAMTADVATGKVAFPGLEASLVKLLDLDPADAQGARFIAQCKRKDFSFGPGSHQQARAHKKQHEALNEGHDVEIFPAPVE